MNNWYHNLFSQNPKPDLKSTRTRADEGNAEAQFCLGLKYSASAGEAQDNVQAAAWYLKAAEQCHPLAQFNLGMMYAQGQGVIRDDFQASAWFEKAARQGDAGGQYHLGMTQHRASSKGLPGDRLESKLEAYKWFYLAASQGYKGSGAACERVTLSMSQEEVADGNRRA